MRGMTGRSIHAGLRAAVLASIAGLTATPAMAQNALGDGRGLDANTGQAGRTNYERPSFANELRFRNAIATGNAPGGLSFRGDLGYRAAGEFSGELGSDDLFSFRRDSIYSGLAGMGIRGTDAIQYQFALTTGDRPPANLVGDLSYQRYASGSGPRTAPIGRDPNAVDARGLGLYQPAPQESELSDALSGMLRNSSTYATTNSLTPVLLTTYQYGIERRPYGLTASPLLGVTASPMGREEEDEPTGPGGALRDPVNDRLKTAYTDVIDSIRARAEEMDATLEGSTRESLEDRVNRLRRALLGVEEPTEGENAQPDPVQDPASAPVQGESDDGATTPVPETPMTATPTGVETQVTLRDPIELAIDPETINLIRGDGEPIQQFVDPNADERNIYAEHMRAGERLIADERYFDAEERFSRALAVQPGDITAQIGRVHAQIGAGLVLSAEVNLRGLLSVSPEMIGVRYAGNLLPAPERVAELKASLRQRAGIGPDGDGAGSRDERVRSASGFLLAYLGHQTRDESAVRDGLDVAASFQAGVDETLIRVLRMAWIPESPDAPEGP